MLRPKKIQSHNYADDLLSAIEQRFGGLDKVLPLGQWAESLPVILDGKKFTFDRHEYLIEPYAEYKHPDQTFLKATQLGLSTLAMLRAIHGARYLGYKGVLYLMPSRSDALDVSKGRINPLLEENPDSLGSWIKNTDSASIKQVWNAFIYFRGMRSRTGLKSVPIDLLINDELDEAPQTALDMAKERMSHSEFKHILKLSNPTLPDYGVDKQFQLTDQRYWMLKCEKCNTYNCLEDLFPGCLHELKDGKVIRACHKCGAELNPSVGQWVAKRPRVEARGYHFSQLFSHYVDPGEILHQFRTTDNLQDFWNLKIGNAYVEAQNRLSIEEVLACCGSEGVQSSEQAPCFMGVDQGKDLHVVIGKRHPAKKGQIVHIEIYKDWSDLDALMTRFNVIRCVVDAMPEMRNARAFANRFPGKVFLNYYSQYQKGSYKWNEAENIVQVNRTESLDASHKQLSDAEIVLPRKSDIVKEFASHAHNMAKRLELEEETGSKRYVYIKLSGPDHFRHAFNYEAIARSYGANSVFADLLSKLRRC